MAEYEPCDMCHGTLSPTWFWFHGDGAWKVQLVAPVRLNCEMPVMCNACAAKILRAALEKLEGEAT